MSFICPSYGICEFAFIISSLGLIALGGTLYIFFVYVPVLEKRKLNGKA